MSTKEAVKLAWCAGILEGEGWICIYTRQAKDRHTSRYKIHVGVTNSDTALLTPFVELWGGRLRPRRGTQLTKKQCFEWRIEDAKAEVFLREIRPYVRGAKIAKLTQALALRDELNSQRRTRKQNGSFACKSSEEVECLNRLIQ